MIKKFCDVCETELVYHSHKLELQSHPNNNVDIDISRDLCFNCAKRIRVAIRIAEKNLKVMDIETI